MTRFFRIEHIVPVDPSNPLLKAKETIDLDLDEVDMLQAIEPVGKALVTGQGQVIRESFGISLKSTRQMIVGRDVYELVQEQLYKAESKRLSVVHD